MGSVKWLEEEIKKFNTVITREYVLTLIEKAKEMEKQEEQEKIDFADKYGTYLLQGGIMSAAAYNETFKSEQTEDTLKLVLNDIKNTPEDVFNKQWASIKKPRTK